MYKTAVSAYCALVSEMSVSDARARLADVVDAARVDHEPVYLTRRGRRVAAIISADDLQRLVEAAEDLADLQAVRTARDEMAAGEPPVSWAELRSELGLT